jgi:hypothetical protein
MNPETPSHYVETITFTAPGEPMPAAKPNTDALRSILDTYAIPDPALVSKLPRGGTYLDYVGHAEITRILIEIDPLWSWEPVAWDGGRPAITASNGIASMWGRLTVLGKTVLGVGNAPEKKPDLDKELVSDFLRNAAMRLGIALSLWSKSDWHDKPAEEPIEFLPNAKGLAENPFEWARTSMLEATSIHALDAVANLAKKRLSEEEREQLRPVYLERKKALEA